MIYLELLWTFFKIGLFTIGGGHAMIPLIMSEVSAHGWIDQQVLIDFIGIAESTPGPFAINIATYTGVERAGVLGAVCATLGVVLPSLIIIIIVSITSVNRDQTLHAKSSGRRKEIHVLFISFNSKISIIKIRSRGFRSMENFMSMIYFVCGELPMPFAPIM